jgi:DNA-binding XRE family transcriptional regulator
MPEKVPFQAYRHNLVGLRRQTLAHIRSNTPEPQLALRYQ